MPITADGRYKPSEVYEIVNDTFNAMTGRTDIVATDTNSLVAMGVTLDALGAKDTYLNTLARRIGHTITDYRMYKSKYSIMAKTALEWGAYVQKIKATMPSAVDDVTWDIGEMDGQSVDQYIISNPKVHQKFYEQDTEYSFFITMSTKLLRDAFLNADAMGAFINAVFGEVENKTEVVMEQLSRLCMANFIGNMDTDQELHLVTMYNATGPETAVNPGTALADADFMRWMVNIINVISDEFEDMSVLYNQGGIDRFTSKSKQRLIMLSPVIRRAETVVQYAAFNPKFVTKTPDLTVPYWQANSNINLRSGIDKISEISVTDRKGKGVVKQNLIGVLYDNEAMGTFRNEEEVLTTPVNARARYYNTFWHERKMWYNDMDEQGVAFYLD